MTLDDRRRLIFGKAWRSLFGHQTDPYRIYRTKVSIAEFELETRRITVGEYNQAIQEAEERYDTEMEPAERRYDRSVARVWVDEWKSIG